MSFKDYLQEKLDRKTLGLIALMLFMMLIMSVIEIPSNPLFDMIFFWGFLCFGISTLSYIIHDDYRRWQKS